MANKSLLVVALVLACIAVVAGIAPVPSKPQPPVIPRSRQSTSAVVRPNESVFNLFWRCLASSPRCNNQPSLVCGTDHRTYINHCVLRKYNCKDRHLKRLFYGHCRPGDVPRTMDDLYKEAERWRGGPRARSQPGLFGPEDEELEE